MHATAIAGYTYRAEYVCSAHMPRALATGPGEPFDGWGLAPGANQDAESFLRETAVAFGINYDDVTSYDSDYFPKPVFWSDHDDELDVCTRCVDSLVTYD